MSNVSNPSPAVESSERLPSAEQTLRRLFLTLFLRGRSSRGMRKASGAPKSVGQRLAMTLVFYFLMGLLALAFAGQGVFVLAVYLHAMTFMFLGMFVASSAGEILFNKDETDILLHRPITARALLWAKVRVLVEVSLWLAGAFNLVGLVVGFSSAQGSWRFPLAHVFSTTLEALFCTGAVVMLYQLCLRWFGRERLEGLMTASQIVVSVAAVLGGQMLPRMAFRMDKFAVVAQKSWWLGVLPPAWFAGIDDALAGGGGATSWLLATLGVVVTPLVLWIAFDKLAGDYGAGLQKLNENVSSRVGKANGGRWLDRLVDSPPLVWWLRDPVARGSFLLCVAYLVRDRDVKLRIYPGIAPMLVLPIVFMLPTSGRGGPEGSGFGTAFAGGYLGLVPLMGLSMLQYSQQWQASDIFRSAPIAGPARICSGARQAVLCFLTVPALAATGLFSWLLVRDATQLLLMLPGVVAVPVFAMLPCFGGGGVPLSRPPDEVKAAGRSLSMIGVIPISLALSGLATWSWSDGWFWRFVTVEACVVLGLYLWMRGWLAKSGWSSME
jgi:ABC-2 type transport system permease protein